MSLNDIFTAVDIKKLVATTVVMVSCASFTWQVSNRVGQALFDQLTPKSATQEITTQAPAVSSSIAAMPATVQNLTAPVAPEMPVPEQNNPKAVTTAPVSTTTATPQAVTPTTAENDFTSAFYRPMHSHVSTRSDDDNAYNRQQDMQAEENTDPQTAPAQQPPVQVTIINNNTAPSPQTPTPTTTVSTVPQTANTYLGTGITFLPAYYAPAFPVHTRETVQPAPVFKLPPPVIPFSSPRTTRTF